MNNEMSIQRLTPEIVEACLDRDATELTGLSDEDIPTGDIWDEMQVFKRVVMASDRIKGELFGIVGAIYGSEADRSTTGLSELERFQTMLQHGQISQRQVEMVVSACRMFFWLGWHSRGAVEEAEALRRMAES